MTGDVFSDTFFRDFVYDLHFFEVSLTRPVTSLCTIMVTCHSLFSTTHHQCSMCFGFLPLLVLVVVSSVKVSSPTTSISGVAPLFCSSGGVSGMVSTEVAEKSSPEPSVLSLVTLFSLASSPGLLGWSLASLSPSPS